MDNNPLIAILQNAKALAQEIEKKGMPESVIPKDKWDAMTKEDKAKVRKQFKDLMKQNNFSDQLKSSIANMETVINKANGKTN